MRYLSIILLGLTLSDANSAEPPALGRLFLDPQQRARLDQQRQHNPGFRPNANDPESRQILNGEVRSSNGRRTRWVNGAEIPGNMATEPPVPVGDTYHPATGERRSLLGDGRILVKRPQP